LNIYQIFEGKDMSAEIQKADECFKALIAANDYFSNKRYEEARERYKVVLEKNPKDPYAKKQYEICEEILSIRQSTAQSQVEAAAKDIITLRSGEDIQALVQEVGDVDVKYKRFDNPNGPSYTLKKSEIFSITYANGSKDVFTNATTPVTATASSTPASTNQQNIQHQKQMSLEPLSIDGIHIFNNNGQRLSKSEVQQLMREVPEALNLLNKGYRRRGAGVALGIPGALLFGTGVGILLSSEGDSETQTIGAAVGGAGLSLFCFSMAFQSSAKKKYRNAVSTYNRGIKPYTADVSLNFGITQSGGIGLTLSF